MMNILIINGPNLNFLGKRDPEIYGNRTLDKINENLAIATDKFNLSLKFFQSNSEGKIIDFLQENFDSTDGIIINPGALTHYGYSLRDALEVFSVPVVEVHISNIFSREEFRKKSVISEVASSVISGFGEKGYSYALEYILEENHEGS